MTERRPFHESVIEVIQQDPDLTSMVHITTLIDMTIVTEGHGAIIDALQEWGVRYGEPDITFDFINDTIRSLLTVKQEIDELEKMYGSMRVPLRALDDDEQDVPACVECGAIMIFDSPRWKCLNCGYMIER